MQLKYIVIFAENKHSYYELRMFTEDKLTHIYWTSGEIYRKYFDTEQEAKIFMNVARKLSQEYVQLIKISESYRTNIENMFKQNNLKEIK
jgi:hypothetical protein